MRMRAEKDLRAGGRGTGDDEEKPTGDGEGRGATAQRFTVASARMTCISLTL
jgi:hypothetical protein